MWMNGQPVWADYVPPVPLPLGTAGPIIAMSGGNVLEFQKPLDTSVFVPTQVFGASDETGLFVGSQPGQDSTRDWSDEATQTGNYESAYRSLRAIRAIEGSWANVFNSSDTEGFALYGPAGGAVAEIEFSWAEPIGEPGESLEALYTMLAPGWPGAQNKMIFNGTKVIEGSSSTPLEWRTVYDVEQLTSIKFINQRTASGGKTSRWQLNGLKMGGKRLIDGPQVKATITSIDGTQLTYSIVSGAFEIDQFITLTPGQIPA